MWDSVANASHIVYKAAMTSSEHTVCVTFAASLRRHVDCAPQFVAPASLREVLDNGLLEAPELSNYVFDDQRAIRKHVAIFVNQQMVTQRSDLNQLLAPGDQVLVIQALTGG